MRPNVIIELKPYLHDYLYHEFGCRPTDEGVNVTAANDIGKFIQAMVTVTDRPPKQAIKEHPITLYLPIQEWNHFILQENFIYIPEWKQRMLQSYIKNNAINYDAVKKFDYRNRQRMVKEVNRDIQLSLFP